MRVQDMFGGLGHGMCHVCGQTPCNCTHVSESLRTENPCWKGYHPVGTKKKNGRTVPNCVPEAANPAQQAAIAIAKKKKAGVAESNDPQSRKLGRIIGRIYNEIYDMGDDALDYLNDRAPVWAQLWDRYEGDIDSIIAEEDPVTLGKAALELKDILNDLQSDQGVAEGVTSPDIKQAYKDIMNTAPNTPERKSAVGKYQKLRADALDKKRKEQGVAEADKLKGTPVVSLSDFGDKDNTKDRYGRTVPRKLKKDDPRVRFHKDYSQHEKKLISKMSNAEKADKGWRNPNIDEQGVAEGKEFGAYYYEQLAQQVFDINPDLTDENEILNLGYKIAKGELGSRAQGVFRDEDFPSDFVSSYGYLKKQGVAEVSDATLTSYLTKVDADSQKHEKDPTKRSAEKRNKSVAGFSRAFNKLDARKRKVGENEGDPEGVPHLTPELASHISQQVKTEGPQAIVKSLEWGDGAAKELLDVFVKELDDIAKGQSNEGVSMNQDDKQLDELNFFKTATAAPKKFASRVGTLPGQQDLTYRKNGEAFTLHQEGESFQLISNGQVVQTFNAPERDVQAWMDKNGYFLVKTPLTPTKTSSLGGPNWFKEGEDDEDDYNNEYQDMVKRMAKKASDQERERGPVDINALSRRLRAISQKDQD